MPTNYTVYSNQNYIVSNILISYLHGRKLKGVSVKLEYKKDNMTYNSVIELYSDGKIIKNSSKLDIRIRDNPNYFVMNSITHEDLNDVSQREGVLYTSIETCLCIFGLWCS